MFDAHVVVGDCEHCSAVLRVVSGQVLFFVLERSWVKALGKQFKDFGRDLLKNGVKVVFASDYVGVDADAERARRYEIWWRTQTFDSNFEVLKQMTSTAGEMLAMSGNRNPYQAGKLGVIEEGAYALVRSDVSDRTTV